MDRLVDNDLVLKSVSYDLVREFWAVDGSMPKIGVLGSAKYVVGGLIDRAGERPRNKAAARAALGELLTATTAVEPTEAETILAAEMEAEALKASLDLDGGESLLAAVAVERGVFPLETGDKRAIVALEVLVDTVQEIEPLAGRVRCLEQLTEQMVTATEDLVSVQVAVCSEPAVDKTLTICFACASGRDCSRENVLAGLGSYIRDLRSRAPTVLVA